MSLRLLYLIFCQVLGLVLLSCRTSSAKDVELLVLRHDVAILRRTNPHHAWTGRTGPCSPRSCGGCPAHCVAGAWSSRIALNVSNVPGPRHPVSVLGAPVRSMHSLVEIGPRHALRVAVVSVADTLCYGLLAAPDVIADLDVLAAAIDEEAATLSGT